jgi:hypothetical protein
VTGSGHGAVVVVRQCDDVCRDECTQDVKTKCEKVPYQEQVRGTMQAAAAMASSRLAHCHRSVTLQQLYVRFLLVVPLTPCAAR